nr:MAG TPA: hypothetical protein [Caudoviricetes sp.]
MMVFASVFSIKCLKSEYYLSSEKLTTNWQILSLPIYYILIVKIAVNQLHCILIVLAVLLLPDLLFMIRIAVYTHDFCHELTA